MDKPYKSPFVRSRRIAGRIFAYFGLFLILAQLVYDFNIFTVIPMAPGLTYPLGLLILAAGVFGFYVEDKY